MYKITARQKLNALKLGVKIEPSKNKSKKLDVYKDGVKLVSIGAMGYNDYDLYIKTKGIDYANERRRLYKIRHNSDRHKKGSAGYYADKILW